MPGPPQLELVYLTSLEFFTDPGTPVGALARHTGISPDEFQRRDNRQSGQGESWRVVSEAEPDATLEEHLTSLMEAFADAGDGSAAEAVREVVLNIGVDYAADRFMPPAIRFPAELISRFHARYPELKVVIALHPGGSGSGSDS